MGNRGWAVVAACAVALSLSACETPDEGDGRIDGSTARPVPTAAATTTPDAATSFPLTAYLVFADADETSVSASGGVDGALVNDATCTFTFSAQKADVAPVSVTSTSIADASNTSCGVVQVPIAQFSAGTWNAVLSFASPQGTATSEPLELEIP
jgi:hypothetical protein